MIVRLNGGLGNQMFQYAFGKSVAEARKEEVFFHKVGLDNGNHRAYGLDVFNTEVKFKEYNGGWIYDESIFRFDPGVYHAPRDAYFTGCWQTEKYFDEDLVRSHFTLRNPLRPQTVEVKNHIGRTLSCSIHVRRTDYLIDSVAKYHGNMTLDWYKRAMVYVADRIPFVTFFVFSDDIDWCKHNFTDEFGPIVFVGHNGYGNGSTGPSTEHEDMYLMACCNHAIIPNSSFGWWGAWLNWNKSRIVIAPKKWFNNPGLAYDDVVPERWIKL